MGSLYNSKGQKIGHLNQDGRIFDFNERSMGKISDDGHLLSASGHRLGHLGSDGRVFREGKWVGFAHADGSAHDTDSHRLGHADQPNAAEGAAAIVIFFNEN